MPYTKQELQNVDFYQDFVKTQNSTISFYISIVHEKNTVEFVSVLRNQLHVSKIITPFVERNQNMVENLRLGAYASQRYYFDFHFGIYLH